MDAIDLQIIYLDLQIECINEWLEELGYYKDIVGFK